MDAFRIFMALCCLAYVVVASVEACRGKAPDGMDRALAIIGAVSAGIHVLLSA